MEENTNSPRGRTGRKYKQPTRQNWKKIQTAHEAELEQNTNSPGGRIGTKYK
jgi:hypothetical protein